MIETTQNTHMPLDIATNQKPRKVFSMVKNERMAGSVPQWSSAKTSTDKIQQTLESAQNSSLSPNNAMAYAGGNASAYQEEFSFGDLLDMVNPLHHVPVLGHIYREVTGDEIKPIGQIMGGAVFGGPVGAASGLVNTIVEEETGKDIAGNTLAMVSKDPFIPVQMKPQTPEKHLEAASQALNPPQKQALPGNLLSFVDLKSSEGIEIHRLEKTPYPDLAEKTAAPREPITEVKLSGLYALAQ